MINILAKIVDIDFDENEKLLESHLFKEVDSIWCKEISDWDYNKILEYDKKYDFNNWEDLEANIYTKYYDNNTGELLRSDEMLDSYMNL